MEVTGNRGKLSYGSFPEEPRDLRHRRLSNRKISSTKEVVLQRANCAPAVQRRNRLPSGGHGCILKRCDHPTLLFLRHHERHHRFLVLILGGANSLPAYVNNRNVWSQ